jgi:dTDP-4-dehydrorhamnose 3,5-epimerase
LLWIPPGFAHGFYVLSDAAHVLYKATEFYFPELERTIVWNDADLNIQWGITGQPLLSSKDAAGRHLREAEVFQ